MSKTVNEQDLKYFTGQALTGILANPYFTTPQAEKYRQMKNLSIERMAVESALGVMEALETVRMAMEQVTQETEKQFAAQDEKILKAVETGDPSGKAGTPFTPDTPQLSSN